jgi:hypothetical protein
MTDQATPAKVRLTARLGRSRGRKSATGLSRTELHQLLDYAQHCENEGWYWGNEAQFRKRHDKLKAWLNAQIDAAA